MFFNALISGLVGLDRNRRDANREMWYTKLGIELLLSFGFTFGVTWGTVGGSMLANGSNVALSLASGFCAGLVFGTGAAYQRFLASPLTKGLGLQVSMDVAKAGQKVEEAGVSVQKN